LTVTNTIAYYGKELDSAAKSAGWLLSKLPTILLMVGVPYQSRD